MRLLLIADTYIPKRARDLPARVWDEVAEADVVMHAGGGPLPLSEKSAVRADSRHEKKTKRTAQTAVLLAILYGARRYYRNWGATKSESRVLLPGDALVPNPAIQTTEHPYLRHGPDYCRWDRIAVGSTVMPDRRIWPAAATTIPIRSTRKGSDSGWGIRCDWRQGGLDGVVRWGDADRCRDRARKCLVLDATREERRWNTVWSFRLQPHWEDRVRLLTRTRIGLRRPGEVFVMELVRPVIALGTRGVLLAIKHRAERLAMAAPAGAPVEQ